MTVFRFKRFQVQNDLSAMKINTDGVLLGAWCSVFPDDKNVLDIGTGTGVVALIVAQRLSEAKRGLPFCGSLSQDDSIIGIDIDDLSVQEAGLNFKNSPWKDNLRAEHCALGDFPSWKADLVVSNPPYFESETRSPSVRRKQARSTDTMSFREVLSYSQANLSDNGRVAMILPADYGKAVLFDASDKGLYLNRITFVSSRRGKPFSRVLTEFSLHRRPLVREEMYITEEDGKYSEEYIKKTSELYFTNPEAKN